jgi:hypothetical protein
MAAKEIIFTSGFTPLRLPGEPLFDTYSGFLEWPSSILLPDRVIKFTELSIRWEIELQIIASDSALAHQYLVGNPTKFNFGNYSLSTKNRVRHFDQLSFENQYLSGHTGTIQLPGSASNRHPDYGVGVRPQGRFVNQSEQQLCIFKDPIAPPINSVFTNQFVSLKPFQIGIGIDDLNIRMTPLQSSVVTNTPIIVNFELEDEIDKFAYFLYSGVDGLIKLSLSISDELESPDYSPDYQFNPGATEPFPNCIQIGIPGD